MSTHHPEDNIPEADLQDQRTPAQPVTDEHEHEHPVMSTDWADQADLQDQRTPVQPFIDEDDYPYDHPTAL
jgi:hypothetical protein